MADGDTYTVRISKTGGVTEKGFYEATFKVGDKSTDIKYGDVDGNDVIDARDAVAVVDHFLAKKKLTGDNLLAANVNADSTVDARDAVMIVDYFLAKIKSFPADNK